MEPNTAPDDLAKIKTPDPETPKYPPSGNPDISDEVWAGLHAEIKQIGSPDLQVLAQTLPIMSNGKPRRFDAYMNCYEWVFTRVQQEARKRNSQFADQKNLIEHTERVAQALWAIFANKERT